MELLSIRMLGRITIPLIYDDVIEIVADGRAGFQTENENHLTNKTKGYHLKHTDGHGSNITAKYL